MPRRRPPGVVPLPPARGRGEVTNLDERLGLLLVVRCGIVAIVVVGSLVASTQLGITLDQSGPLSAFYLVLAGAVEWFRRSGRRSRLDVHQAMLPLDSLYLAFVTASTGGPRSELIFLFSIHLIATTLLGSPRTGIRLALWDSFLFVAIATFSGPTEIGRLLGVRVVEAHGPVPLAVAILALWAVALSTAFFSSVSERELRRSKAELSALAALAVELEAATQTAETLVILLRSTVGAFGFKRGALYWGNGRKAHALTARADGSGTAGVRLDEVSLESIDAFDLCVTQRGADRTPILVRHLGSAVDPILARLLPAARNVVVVPLPVDGDHTGALALERGGPWAQKVPRRSLVVLEQFCTHASITLRSVRMLAEMERMAAIDGLTGLANRREFETTLSREVGRAQRTGHPLSLVVVDVDHFKAINDSHGHLAGDEVLRSLARVLQGEVRDMDVVARYGGEEFVVVLPDCGLTDALRVGERVRAAVAVATGLPGVTVSGGVATLPDHADTGVGLVAAADEAMYSAKRSGRDRLAWSTRRGGPQSEDLTA